MDVLRDEIIESQKGRADLLKWKLILVAALGGVGLGFKIFGEDDAEMSLIVLCLIPLGCAYVDLLCYHLLIRNIVIGAFQMNFRNPAGENESEKKIDTFARYEAFVDLISNMPDRCGHCFKKYSLILRDLGLLRFGLRLRMRPNWITSEYANRPFDLNGLMDELISAKEGNCCHCPRRCTLLRSINSSRVKAVISGIAQTNGSPDQREQLNRRLRRWDELLQREAARSNENAFGFENWILQYSTNVLCALLVVFGLVLTSTRLRGKMEIPGLPDYVGPVIVGFSAISWAFSWWIHLRYRDLVAEIRFHARRCSCVTGRSDRPSQPVETTCHEEVEVVIE